MDMQAGVNQGQRYTYSTIFAADWLVGPAAIGKVMPRRWDRLHDRMVARMAGAPDGQVYPVERRRGLTPDQFKQEYFLTGKPVVLEGAGAEWPAISKWTFEYLLERCGQEDIDVLDGQNWRVNRDRSADAVATSEKAMKVGDLLREAQRGGAWYGAFMELLDKYADMRADLDLSFVRRYGHANPRIPWHRNVIAKMYVGGPNTSTSLHCAGVSNLYLQAHGRKKWVLVAPRFTPFMYPALSKGLNWQSRVDFRQPDCDECPLYRYVDRYETVLEPGDILWNPPWVWHGVMNLTDSIAVSLWWVNVSRAFANNTVFSALTLLGRPNPMAMQLGLSRKPRVAKSAFSVHLNK
jgi:hypothetical protein